MHSKPSAKLIHGDRCIVCGEPIPYLSMHKNMSSATQHCTSIECKNVLQQQERLPTAAFEHFLKNHQASIKKRKLDSINKQKQLEAEHEENLLIFSRVKEARIDSDQLPEHRVTLPTAQNDLAPLDNERIHQYIEYLSEIISEATSYDSVASAPADNNHKAHLKLLTQEAKYLQNPHLKATLDSLCMQCEGSCCASGAEHAYHSVFSIRRILDENPQHNGESLLEEYRSRLKSSTVGRGCINQADQGCVVPRELRSDICNQFYCRSVAQYDDKIKSDEQLTPVVAIQRKYSLWNRPQGNAKNSVTRIALVDAENIEILDKEPLLKASDPNNN